MKTWLIASFAVAALGAQAQAADPLKAAVAADHRSVGNVARDAWRHPYETLNFFGIKPTDTVVELAPGGGGWYTEILAPYLRDAGQLIAAADDPASSSQYAQRSAARFKAKMDSLGVYGKVRITVLDVAAGKLDVAPAGSADAVLTFRNVHNWMPQGADKTQAVFHAAFKALKPGGVLGVVEHRLPATRPQDPKAASGYVQEAVVIKFAEAAGFKLAARSEINANPKDTADHENGVWTLPPVNNNKDRARYAAIGESDRMTLKFVKP
ncbi:class I SAM-dependent methyltransferase [Roseateles sp. LKC17W]|uniref:Class I SAM-dependent methyltransferase n=1 Tax=Pelomonas margarita TaxID=3299031 RepID=A0ABW7FLE5_9BURK